MEKKILLAGLIVLAAAFSGCVEQEEEDICADMAGADKDFCYAGKAADELDPSNCSRISDQETEDDCYLAVAALGGEYWCGYVEDSTKYDTCQYMRAITFVKEEYCHEIRDDAAEQVCLEDVAKKK